MHLFRHLQSMRHMEMSHFSDTELVSPRSSSARCGCGGRDDGDSILSGIENEDRPSALTASGPLAGVSSAPEALSWEAAELLTKLVSAKRNVLMGIATTLKPSPDS